MKDVIAASDLVGCRYRLVQRRRHPEVPRTHAAQARAERMAAARDVVSHKLPASSKRVRRIDLGPLPADDPIERSLATLEALATGYTHITGAVFCTDEWLVNVDLLLREDPARAQYTPVLVSNHRVARRHGTATLLGVPTHRLGLSAPLELPAKARHHTVDGYRFALAARALADLGLDSGRGAVVGQDRDVAYFVDPARYQPALQAALGQPLPDGPLRVKECATCRFWQLCEPELRQVDEISLFLPGDRARTYRERGIETVQGLIDADLGETSALAAAWRAGTVLLRRSEARPQDVPRADVEVDVDMEAYLDQGAYLWGAWHEGKYHPFVTWEPLGGAHEAHNFQDFWAWLMGVRDEAHAAGRTFAAYCYSAHGENHWMTMSAKRFGAPTPAEVSAFIGSDDWIDLFAYVRRAFVGPFGLGLKVVAPQSGFHWQIGGFDGEESVNARRRALAGDMQVREQLLTYNADDVRATRAVRDWMSAGAPGINPL